MSLTNSAATPISILVPDPVGAFLEAKVASREYASASDYVTSSYAISGCRRRTLSGSRSPTSRLSGA
jgi:hypothetical protein